MLLRCLIGFTGPIAFEIAAAMIDKALLTGAVSAITKSQKVKSQLEKESNQDKPETAVNIFE